MTIRLQRPAFLATTVLAMCWFAPLTPAHAADPTALERSAAAAADCRGLVDGVARLSCYDRAFGVAIVPATVPAPIAANTVAGFGLSAEEREQRSRAPTAEPPRQLDEVAAKVTAIKQPRAGRFTVTLDNGQVWQQRETDSSIYLRVGDRITIKKAVLGSYLLVTEGRRSTKVERVK